MRSIRSRIIATYLALAIAVVGGVSIVLIWNIDALMKNELVSDLNHQASWVYYSLTLDPAATTEHIDQQIRRIAELENFRITLIAENGKLIDDSGLPLDSIEHVENHLYRPEVQQALVNEYGWHIRHSATVGKDFLYVAKKIPVPPDEGALRSIGFVRLCMPLEEVYDRINSLRALVVFVGFVVLVIVVGVSYFVARRISNPMNQITQAVERIHAGDLDTHIQLSSGTEIVTVANAINELVDKLKADIVQMRKLQKARSEFLGNVSHELRTPIFAIQGFIETLLNGAVDDRTVNRTFLEKARSNANRLNTLLEDLINISQIESGDMKMSFRYFTVNDFVEGVVQDFRQAAGQSGISVVALCKTARDVEVLGDRDRLRQVLSNLIDNGMKYNVPGGKVSVTTESKDGTILVSVSDTGVGIAAEHLPRIFERFYRVDKDRSREVGGTGLGLAIVKHIVEAHGSTIEVESQPGKGSTFRFTLKK